MTAEKETTPPEYSPPSLEVLGSFWAETLIGKNGSLTDGIHVLRQGGPVHDSSA